MSLTTSGIIQLTDEPIIKEWNGNYFFNMKFVSYSLGKRKGDPPEQHHWNVSMWVGANECEEWKEKLQPGRDFDLRTAEMTSLIPNGKDYPFTKIKISTKNLVPLRYKVDRGD